MGRGLYKQSEGWESRPAQDAFAERLVDNETIEGDYVAALHNHVEKQDWVSYEKAVAELRRDGFSAQRITSMTNRAMAGLKF